MGTLESFASVFDRIARLLMSAAALMLLAMVALINVEVAGRYLFGYSTLISDEYSGYLFCWIVMLGMLYVARSDRLLRVDAIHRCLPAIVRNVLEVVNAILCAVLCAILTYAGWETFWISWLFQTASAYVSETRLYFIQFVMPLGLGMLTIAFVELAFRKVVRFGKGGTDPS